MMRCLRRLWRAWRHDPLAGWELRAGIWYGPNGERCRSISGGQEWGGVDPGIEPSTWGGGGVGGSVSDYSGGGSPFYDFAASLGTGIGRGIGRGYDWLTSTPGREGPPPAAGESPLSAFSKVLGLGATGLGVANQFNVAGQLGRQTKNIERGQQQAQAAAAPAVEFGRTTLERAAGGNLTPALQAGIDQWVQKAKADAAARFASMGLGNSTQIDSINRLIDEQAMAMKGSMLQQQEETGLAGLQTGVSAGTGVMGVSVQQQQMLAQLIQQANQALGQMAGRAP